MRTTVLLLGAGVVVCVVAATQPTQTQEPQVAAAPVVTPATRTVANVPMPTLSPGEEAALTRATAATRLDAARAHVAAVAQRAVLDRDEQLFREPTAAEAAALALPAETAAAQEIPVPVGGYAVKTDASGLSLAVATVGPRGVVSGHGTKGGHRDQ